MMLKTLQLSKSGLKVCYRDQGVGEPLVLIHGVGLQSAAWGPQTAALQDVCRVIALDMPGHGGSDPLPTGSQLPDFVAWCHAAVLELGLGPVNLAGHSMGALIAAGFTARHPDLTRRVALLNGVYRRDDISRHAVEARAAEIERGNVDLETPLTRWFGETAIELDAKAQVATWLGAVDLTGYATAYTAFAHGDATYADQLPNIACPFLSITGDGDPNSTPDMSIAMAKLVQNGTAITIKGHRHMVNLTAASEVNAHLLTWLKVPTTQKELQ
ncbi:alpha/beta hydrolase [Sulfitobacter sp. SK012]|uniref:alpha/beta fold hydrolase n=1 Tax=Sulfitobacter sp. SK012 TaxID=1389005 RepID=UPI000E0B1D3C|nr:alpha/beta hydrolase [Sulfitobacter sp. SK012]AXI47687.1 alpha/beta hydrolase [Sulfitobacter sp. SK012]